MIDIEKAKKIVELWDKGVDFFVNEDIDFMVGVLKQVISAYAHRDWLPTEENLHKYYLEGIKPLKTESFNQNSNKPFNELTDEQKFIDNFISEAIRSCMMKGK